MKTVSGVSYIEWSAVAAGTAIALAVSLILLPFGNAIGLTTEAQLDQNKAQGMVIAIGIWILWVQLLASLLGGYAVGRAARAHDIKAHENEFRDGMHGLVVWAISTVLTAIGITVVTTLGAIAADQGSSTAAQIVNADLTRTTDIIFNFAVAASAIVSAVAAWVMATIGGDHRDSSYDLTKFSSFRKKAKK